MAPVEKDPFKKLPARESTKRLFEKVAAAKRWSLTVTTEEAIKALAEREGVELEQNEASTATAAA